MQSWSYFLSVTVSHTVKKIILIYYKKKQLWLSSSTQVYLSWTVCNKGVVQLYTLKNLEWKRQKTKTQENRRVCSQSHKIMYLFTIWIKVLLFFQYNSHATYPHSAVSNNFYITQSIIINFTHVQWRKTKNSQNKMLQTQVTCSTSWHTSR